MSDTFTMADFWPLMETRKYKKNRKGNQKGKNNNNYSTGAGLYAKTLVKKCARCGTTSSSKFQVHHKDGNRENNAPSNLESLCGSCHEITKSRARGLKIDNKRKRDKK